MSSKANHAERIVHGLSAARGLLLAAALPLLVASCAEPPPPPKPAVDPVETALIETARKSADAVRALAETEISRTPPVRVAEQEVPAELRRSISVHWTGPIGPMVKSIATELNYDFAEIGKPPISSIVVDIKATDRPIYQILEDVGLQAGTRADVALNPQRRTIEIRYAG